MMSPRLVPCRSFPAYAYLPGRHPHPVRDTDGHSYGVHLDIHAADAEAELFWGADLFDAGYYWESHEAWESLWQAADRGSAKRSVLKGLILLAAAGLKLREGKKIAALRHANRAVRNFEDVSRDGRVTHAPLRYTADAFVGFLKDVDWRPPLTQPDPAAPPIPVFSFRAGFVLRRSASALTTSGRAVGRRRPP